MKKWLTTEWRTPAWAAYAAAIVIFPLVDFLRSIHWSLGFVCFVAGLMLMDLNTHLPHIRRLWK